MDGPSDPRTGRMDARAAVARRVRVLLVFGCLAVGLLLAFAGGAVAEDPSPSPSSAPNGSALPADSGNPAASARPTLSVVLESPTPEPTMAILVPPPPKPIVHPTDGDSNTCYDCHSAVNNQQKAIADAWQASIHGKNGVTCADCHGGDPRSDSMGTAMDVNAGFIGKPSRDATVGLCGGCHSDSQRMQQYKLPTDQYTKYYTSVHGQQLLTAADTRVAICIDCHGSHDIKKASDPTAAVYPTNVPKLCASCHADATRMQPYGIPTDQYAIYEKSVHGQALLVNGDTRAPSCASCHGSHDAKPPTSDTVVNVCGKCHTATEDLYKQSRHSELGTVGPKCWTCHGTHDVSQPSEAMFFHDTPPEYVCSTCHDLETRQLRIELSRFANPADRKCDTCHHPDSDIYAQAKAIDASLAAAETAYAEAEARIADAAALGMIVSDADVALTEAKTSLIKAQAAVHTTKLTLVSTTAGDAETKADSATAMAQSKLDESTFRRSAMVIVVGLILLIVLALFLLKLELDRDREREREQQARGSPGP
jgi:hypothetical protein